jgi:hypothetical protein
MASAGRRGANTARHYREAGHGLDDLATQTDKGIVLATALTQSLRSQSILLPSISVIERICAEAVTRATRRIHGLLTESLTDLHRRQLDGLLNPREKSNASAMIWLRQSPGAPSANGVRSRRVQLGTCWNISKDSMPWRR